MSRERSRILVVKLSSIGDVVQALPVAGALRRRYPAAHLAWAVGPAAAGVVVGNPHLDEVIVVGGSESNGVAEAAPPLTEPGRLRRALRARGFDTAVDLQGLLKSAAVAFLSGARERIGFRSLHEATFLLNNRPIVPNRRDVHAVESYLDFAEALGAAREPVEFPIAISEDDRRVVDGLLAGRERLAALIPGARWESKLWPVERFAAVAKALWEEEGLAPVVVGAAGDGELAGAIEKEAGTPVVDLTGKTTLKQVAEAFRRCRVAVGNDTGPLYISAAMGTPTVALFGPSGDIEWGPWRVAHRVVASTEHPCRPCGNNGCGGSRRSDCLISLPDVRVAAAISDLLDETAGAFDR